MCDTEPVKSPDTASPSGSFPSFCYFQVRRRGHYNTRWSTERLILEKGNKAFHKPCLITQTRQLRLVRSSPGTSISNSHRGCWGTAVSVAQLIPKHTTCCWKGWTWLLPAQRRVPSRPGMLKADPCDDKLLLRSGWMDRTVLGTFRTHNYWASD